MRIGLLDVDSHNYPNIALMKLSAYHKSIGDSVEWYQSFTGHYDKVYCSKVFSFTEDIDYVIDADEVIYGGTGYAISDTGGASATKHPRILPFPMRLNISILTILSTGSRTQHMDSCQEDVPVAVSFAS